MKGIILYTSKYGSAKRYARMIAEETGFDCMETSKAKAEDVSAYDAVILGGGVYASSIAGLQFLKKNFDRLQGKKVIVYAVGASPYDENEFQKLKETNLKDSLADLPCFYCRGALDIEHMNFVDRNLCRMLVKAASKKKTEERDAIENTLIEAGSEKRDWTDPVYIAPVLEELKSAE